jgi:hypothetical protein
VAEGNRKGTPAGNQKGAHEGTPAGTPAGNQKEVQQGEPQGSTSNINEVFENAGDSQELDGTNTAISASDLRLFPASPAFPLVSHSVQGPSNLPNRAQFESASFLSSSELLTDQKQGLDHPLREGPTPSTTADSVPSAAEVKDAATDEAIADNLPSCAPRSSATAAQARPSVAEYFANAGSDILDAMCDGEFNPEIEKVWKRWNDLDYACREVVRTYSTMILVDRRTLAHLIGKVMDVLKRDHTGPDSRWLTSKAPWPPGLLKAKAALMRGGAPLRDRPAEKGARLWEHFTAEVMPTPEYQAMDGPERSKLWDEYYEKHIATDF